MAPEIAVVVVTYNSSAVIGDLLDSLPAALAGLSARVVVVDNGSSDDTCDVVSRRGDCVLVREQNRGYAAGLNTGVRALPVEGPILLLNPDVRMDPGSVAVMASTLQQPRTAAVVPRLVDDHGQLSLSLRREPTLGRALGLGRTRRPALSETVQDHGAYASPHVTDWATGAVMLLSRECFDALGGWDESYFLYSEETDYCLRARDIGWVTRYEPAALAVHIGGQSGRSARIHAMQIVNRVRLFRRRHGRGASVLYLLLAVASETSWVLRGHHESATAIKALLVPGSRPVELGCSDRMLPS
ncbi:glycosyltransferase family 2 protein [Aeromicrobium chenweiae]|uniref:glycosyltransferase family 2 protein n=1 Tax=Aeromicrobium chenweiae TaxID=2079793 RepID=UPI00131F473D|nr:glycosyltransferase family 2 protein [Aeromicrobium chenweiae]